MRQLRFYWRTLWLLWHQRQALPDQIINSIVASGDPRLKPSSLPTQSPIIQSSPSLPVLCCSHMTEAILWTTHWSTCRPKVCININPNFFDPLKKIYQKASESSFIAELILNPLYCKNPNHSFILYNHEWKTTCRTCDNGLYTPRFFIITVQITALKLADLNPTYMNELQALSPHGWFP